MKRSFLSLAVALGLVVSTGAAQAQKPVSIGVSGGLSVANGDFAQAVNAGYNISGMVGLHAPALPVSLRAELQYQRFGLKDLPAGLGGNWSTTAGIANLLYQLPTPVVSPYVTGGIGLYHVSVSGLDGSANKFGYNLGAGIAFHLASFGTFIEGDWQSVSMDGGAMRSIPLRFGVTF
ncbi:MAG TPA: outer membrane beta-barrel protein [Gemmatimonadaceae bacterium]|nr:outer membrane beta-barrel protein [Gemmatimonadaceae bacterium]